MKPMDRFELIEKANCKKRIDLLDARLIKRVDFVIRSVLHQCGWKAESWYTEIQNEEYVCDVEILLTKNHIDMEVITIDDLKPIDALQRTLENIVIDGKDYNIFEMLPTRWLFEDFRAELKEAVKLATAQQDTQRKLIAETMSKLTKEEITLLGLAS